MRVFRHSRSHRVICLSLSESPEECLHWIAFNLFATLTERWPKTWNIWGVLAIKLWWEWAFLLLEVNSSSIMPNETQIYSQQGPTMQCFGLHAKQKTKYLIRYSYIVTSKPIYHRWKQKQYSKNKRKKYHIKL